MRVKKWVAKKAPSKSSHLVLSHCCNDDRIVLVPKSGRVETKVTRKKRRLPQVPQQYDYVFVFKSSATDVEADLSNGDAQPLQQQTLPVEDVLIKDDHERNGWRMYSAAAYCPA